jgi:hypothetical protein
LQGFNLLTTGVAFNPQTSKGGKRFKNNIFINIIFKKVEVEQV